MYFSMKPLYAAQRQFQWRRHRQRLQSISSDRPKLSLNNKFSQFYKMRQRSCEIKLQQIAQKQNQQNTKLLNKLLQISKKKSPTFDTYMKKQTKKINPQQHFNNPFRRKLIRQIQIQNSILGSRLLYQKSQFSQINTDKSINQYVKIKKTLQKNRKVKLQPFNNNINCTKSSNHISRVTQNQPCSEYRYSNYNKQMNQFQAQKYHKMKTEPTNIHLELVPLD